jgi:hypothetical protein
MRMSIIDSTYYITKRMFCPRNNDVHRINEDILNNTARH